MNVVVFISKPFLWLGLVDVCLGQSEQFETFYETFVSLLRSEKHLRSKSLFMSHFALHLCAVQEDTIELLRFIRHFCSNKRQKEKLDDP